MRNGSLIVWVREKVKLIRRARPCQWASGRASKIGSLEIARYLDKLNRLTVPIHSTRTYAMLGAIVPIMVVAGTIPPPDKVPPGFTVRPLELAMEPFTTMVPPNTVVAPV